MDCIRNRCKVCSLKPAEFKGRCRPCQLYYRIHGVERPLELIERSVERASKPRWCKVCNKPSTELRRLRCERCYRYWLLHRKDRPRHYWCDDLKCKVCQIPLSAAKRVIQGHCKKCYEYKRKFDRQRPQHLWGNGPFGYCECGQPANHMIDKFPLCDSCAVEYKKGAYS